MALSLSIASALASTRSPCTGSPSARAAPGRSRPRRRARGARRRRRLRRRRVRARPARSRRRSRRCARRRDHGSRARWRRPPPCEGTPRAPRSIPPSGLPRAFSSLGRLRALDVYQGAYQRRPTPRTSGFQHLEPGRGEPRVSVEPQKRGHAPIPQPDNSAPTPGSTSGSTRAERGHKSRTPDGFVVEGSRSSPRAPHSGPATHKSRTPGP